VTPTILLVRHGNTTYDNKVDALLDPPLNEDGMERLRRTIKFLDDSPYRSPRILSSPLQRALKVADMISRGNSRVTTHNEALPWNLGDLMGKPTAKAGPTIDLLKSLPDLTAPHGESYRTFHNRWEAFLHRVMRYAELRAERPIMIVSHSRNINDLQSIIGGAPVGDVQETTPEASVTLLTKNEDGDWQFQLIWEGV
jgi:broad specificity phosphatase PhoE